MKNDYKYLKYLIKHKYYVAKECFKVGLYWRGIVHDLSKFTLSEWIAYRNYFYGTPDEIKFNEAWLNHIHKNKHHHQHWVLRNDDGTVVALDIPNVYVLEMVCDWIGAGLAITGRREVKEWYEKNKDKMVLSDLTKAKVNAMIELLA